MRILLVRLLPVLLRLAMEPALRRALPVIYARLDGELALWLQEALGPAAVQGRVASAVGDALGRGCGGPGLGWIPPKARRRRTTEDRCRLSRKGRGKRERKQDRAC